MIPKIIHYCWFGGNPIPERDKKCIESWRKYCPDYEIKEWNESNYDISKNTYMSQAYQAKKWGFVPDYARLDIVYEQGGIYLDTDVELIRPIDELLSEDAFMGFETVRRVAPGLGFGAIPHHPMIGELRDRIYGEREFIKEDGSLDLTASPELNTEILNEKGLKPNNEKQVVGGITVYPMEYFCPMDFMSKRICITKHTYSIHHYNGSWLTEEEAFRTEVRAKLCRIMPKRAAQHVSKLIAVTKYRGIGAAVTDTSEWLKIK